MEETLNKPQTESCTIHDVVCSYCSKEVKTGIIELDGELMHYDCANKRYVETRGDEGCVTYEELQDLIP